MEDVRCAMAVLSDMDLSPEWSGLNIWITGEPTPKQTVELVQVFGCRWSEKRGRWYLRAKEGLSDD